MKITVGLDRRLILECEHAWLSQRRLAEMR